jgi:DNA-directed RNA polymerase specialized sigma24 family protein
LDWLDEGRDSAGRRYLETRGRLVRYFQCKRCANADDLADETLNRVARRLEEAGPIIDTPPARYCYIVAKFVLLEHLRRPDQQNVRPPSAFDRLADSVASSHEAIRREGLLDCLDRCMRALPVEDARLILDYYRGEQRVKIEQRRRLAAERQLSMNALKIRACRIREKLEACINACRAERETGTFLPVSSQGDD